MTDRESEVLELIQNNPLISQKECARILGISRSSVAVHIMNLSNKGYIKGKGYILQDEPYAVVIGGSNMDIMGCPENTFIERDSNPGSILFSPGGVGRNIAENLARIGFPVKLLSVVGDDINGRELIESCSNAGIDINRIKTSSRGRTSVYLSIQDDHGDMISAISDMSVISELDVQYLEKNHRIIQNASLLVLDANLPVQTIHHLTEKYQEKEIFIDTVSTAKAPKFLPVINRIHTIKPNKLEAEILTGITIKDRSSAEKALDRFMEMGVKRVFLSMGTSGVFYRDREQTIHYENRKMEAVNTTGAGDAYTAALAYSFVKGFSPAKTLAFSSAASTMTLMCKHSINREISSTKIEEMIKGEIFHE